MGRLLDAIQYANIDIAEIGQYPNIGYGTVEAVRCHAIEAGATTLPEAGIAEDATSFGVMDISRFPAAPFTVQIGRERMRVTAVTGNAFSAVTRGYGGTRVEAHASARTVFEVRPSYAYLIAAHPVRSVGAVYTDGVRVLDGYTVYTGQSGDEHPDYPGRAVLVFDAEESLRRQYGIDPSEAVADATGITVDATPARWSHRELADGMSNTYAQAGGTGTPDVWMGFEAGYGNVLSQTYAFRVNNPDASDRRLNAYIRRGGIVMASATFQIKAASTEQLSITQDGGEWADELALVPKDGFGMKVYSIAKTVKTERDFDEGPEAVSAPAITTGNSTREAVIASSGRPMLWCAYSPASAGVIRLQRHEATVTETTGTADATMRLCGEGLASVAFTIKAGATETVAIEHEGGTWAGQTRVVLQSGSARISGMKKSVTYVTPEMDGDARPATTATCRAVVGDVIAVDADFAVDETGDYGGAGQCITRPDRVLRHLLLEWFGYGVDEIDTDSFDAAGASYGGAIAGGYRFGFVFEGEIVPSGTLRRLAYECRSTLRYARGKWMLNYLPDAAPEAARTISRAQLAGEHAGFVFEKTGTADMANSISAKYRRAYLDETWDRVTTAEDAASIAKYGLYPRQLELMAVRDSAMADHVLGHVLGELKSPLLRVSFPVFFDQFDLRVGDTVQIDNPLWGGKLFYIETIERADKFMADVRALEWRV